MKIYTKTGDAGETGLLGGPRVRKDHPRIRAYGDVDELNSYIGMVRFHTDGSSEDHVLKSIQNTLFEVGAILSAPDPAKLSKNVIDDGAIRKLEHAIDSMDAKLAPLKAFILPGGSEVAGLLHVARTICRRAEREVVAVASTENIDVSVICYLNRLSDYLFVLARWENHKAGIPDTIWEKSH